MFVCIFDNSFNTPLFVVALWICIQKGSIETIVDLCTVQYAPHLFKYFYLKHFYVAFPSKYGPLRACLRLTEGKGMLKNLVIFLENFGMRKEKMWQNKQSWGVLVQGRSKLKC